MKNEKGFVFGMITVSVHLSFRFLLLRNRRMKHVFHLFMRVFEFIDDEAPVRYIYMTVESWLFQHLLLISRDVEMTIKVLQINH